MSGASEASLPGSPNVEYTPWGTSRMTWIWSAVRTIDRRCAPTTLACVLHDVWSLVFSITRTPSMDMALSIALVMS